MTPERSPARTYSPSPACGWSQSIFTMSTQLLDRPVAPAECVPEISAAEPLRDIVNFASSTPAPVVPWLTQIELDRPRINVHCLSAAARRSKRVLDVVLSIAMLVVLSPVMLLTAIAVLLTSRGSVIFRQTRVGLNLRTNPPDRRQEQAGPHPEYGERRQPAADRRNQHSYGRHFTLYKFRTMRTNAEMNGAQFAQKNDKRITSIGGFLRKTRLDELPQLWNVLKGEMTLVGPRPERPEFIKELSDEIPDYLARLGLPPGLTGVAQVVNGYDNDIEGFRRKVAFDLLYLQNCCVKNDLKILLRTIRVVLTGSGAL
ncbi:MAG: sugar transferase [Planctomycetaceae bacterium]